MLTPEDIKQLQTVFETDVRLIVHEETASVVSRELGPITVKIQNQGSQLEAIYNDVKDIYHMISNLQKTDQKLTEYSKQTVATKILATHKELLAIAKAEGITLPSS